MNTKKILFNIFIFICLSVCGIYFSVKHIDENLTKVELCNIIDTYVDSEGTRLENVVPRSAIAYAEEWNKHYIYLACPDGEKEYELDRCYVYVSKTYIESNKTMVPVKFINIYDLSDNIKIVKNNTSDLYEGERVTELISAG